MRSPWSASSARDTIRVRQRRVIPFREIAATAVRLYPRRTVLGLPLFIGQAFLYNAVYFTYALVLATFFGVQDADVGLYLIPIGLGNFLGAFFLSKLFDTVGRKAMTTGCYVGSGVLLVGTGFLFREGMLVGMDAHERSARLRGAAGGRLRAPHRRDDAALPHHRLDGGRHTLPGRIGPGGAHGPGPARRRRGSASRGPWRGRSGSS